MLFEFPVYIEKKKSGELTDVRKSIEIKNAVVLSLTSITLFAINTCYRIIREPKIVDFTKHNMIIDRRMKIMCLSLWTGICIAFYHDYDIYHEHKYDNMDILRSKSKAYLGEIDSYCLENGQEIDVKLPQYMKSSIGFSLSTLLYFASTYRSQYMTQKNIRAHIFINSMAIPISLFYLCNNRYITYYKKSSKSISIKN